MKHTSRIQILLILGCLLLCPLVSRADEQTTAFQISLANPAQLYTEDYSVDGLRIDLFYGVNKNVQGIDIGLVNQTNRSAQGFELGAVNIVKQDFTGFQAAVFYNDTQEEMQGLQLGIVNHAGSLDGVQIGLLNFNDDTRYLGFLPFINAAF